MKNFLQAFSLLDYAPRKLTNSISLKSLKIYNFFFLPHFCNCKSTFWFQLSTNIADFVNWCTNKPGYRITVTCIIWIWINFFLAFAFCFFVSTCFYLLDVCKSEMRGVIFLDSDSTPVSCLMTPSSTPKNLKNQLRLLLTLRNLPRNSF